MIDEFRRLLVSWALLLSVVVIPAGDKDTVAALYAAAKTMDDKP